MSIGKKKKKERKKKTHVHKKNEIMSFAVTWMDQDIVILSEIRQTEKDRYYMITLICVILKNDANLSTKQKYSYRCKKQTYGYH